MQADKAIEFLQRQRQATAGLRTTSRSGPAFVKWKRDTEIAISNIFPPGSRNLSDFRSISYISMATFTGDDRDDHDVFLRGLAKAEAVLDSMVGEIREFPHALDDKAKTAPDSIKLLEQICLKFQAAAQVLQDRHQDRPSIEINDEYDVQDLLHAFLRLHFDDIRKEEFAPSYAGGNSRVDFLLKKERILIEVKKTRSGLKAKEIGEQLIIDRAKYESHPDCDTLICFVFDPDKRISNPAGIQHDLENHKGRLKVRVIIAPN